MVIPSYYYNYQIRFRSLVFLRLALLQINPYCGVNHKPYYGLFVSIKSLRFARPPLKKAGAGNAVNLSNPLE